ncbi:cation-translocating P-type ATPase [Desulfocurvus sp. DL9XJH121]
MSEESWHALDVPEAVRRLGADPLAGLCAEDAAARLAEHGPNELAREERTSPLALFLGQFKNVLMIILLAAIALSALVGEVVDAAIIAAIVVFCALLGFTQEYRAERALEALRRMLSPSVRVLRGGRAVEIPTREVVPGDVLLLEAGDRVPADARLVECHSLACDEAPLTGESMPVRKSLDPLPADIPTGDRVNMVFTGATVTYGRGRGVVTATGMRTAFGRIAGEVASVEREPTPLERRTAEIGRWLGLAALSICVLVAGLSMGREALAGKLDLSFAVTVVMFAVALAVAAVPEALAAIVTGALAIGMRRMARHGALVRRMPAVETLGCTTVICSDKTGTLTRGEMTVRRVVTLDGHVRFSGRGYAPEGGLEGDSGPLAPADLPRAARRLLTACVLCSDADLRRDERGWSVSGGPTEGALLVAAMKAGLDKDALRRERPRVMEIPFSSERKRMSVVCQGPAGALDAYMKGAPERVLERCDRVAEGQGERPMTEADREAVREAWRTMAANARRVLGLAWKPCGAGGVPERETVEQGMVFLGLAGMMDPPREEAVRAVAVCREVGIRPVMITGDHRLTAQAVAREIGIYREGDLLVTGEELATMSDEELQAQVERISVYARVSPMDKLKIVRAFKARGEVVAMTGDGVNDAPALKHADIGVAMGVSGTEVAREAADMVLTDDNFASIVQAVELGRWIYDNIKKYLTFLLRCNITEVAVIGGAVLVMGPEYLPLLPAAILYINLATDGLPALALGVAPPDPDLMSRPPRAPGESVFTWDVKAFTLMAVLIEIPLFLWVFFHDFKDIEHARSELFFLFFVVELVIALNFRSMRYSVFRAPPHFWLVASVVWEAALLGVLVCFEPVRRAFGVALPSAGDAGFIAACAALVFVSMEGVKMLVRGRGKA